MSSCTCTWLLHHSPPRTAMRKAIAPTLLLVLILCHALCVNCDRLILPRPIRVRGGGGGGPYEINPSYSQRPTTLGDLEERPSRFTPVPTGTIFSIDASRYSRQSLPAIIVQYCRNLHDISPSLLYTLLSCVTVFGLWQIPVAYPLLRRFFILNQHSRRSVDRILPMLLSTVSHMNFFHLFFNLISFLTFGTAVREVLRPNSMWPFLMGSALSGSWAFLFWHHGRNTSCLGLSGVSLALLALYAKLFPKRTLGVVVAGIVPVRLPAEQVLNLWILVSVYKMVRPGNTNVAHSVHLGGMLFGLVYYEVWSRRQLLASSKLGRLVKRKRKTLFGR